MHGDAAPAAMPPQPKQLLELFSRSLTSFQASQDVFRVVCTLPHATHRSAPDPSWRRPSKRVRNLVVLDSSFNPPTRAHAHMARSALEALRDGSGSVRLVLLLAVNNADKAPKPASFPVRMGMMEGFGRELLAELGGRALREDDDSDDTDAGVQIDLAVTTMPYFHDKARAIAESGFYGSSGAEEAQQTFLTGFDTLIRIFNPKYYTKSPSSAADTSQSALQAALGPFFSRAGLRVTIRPDDSWGGREEQVAYVQELKDGKKMQEVGGDVWWMDEVELVDGEEGRGSVSSSRVREMVKDGDEKLDGLVYGEVKGWIEKEGLYRGG